MSRSRIVYINILIYCLIVNLDQLYGKLDIYKTSIKKMKKPHVCTEPGCKAKFARPNRLEAHLRKHKGERPFTCDEDNCKKSYTNQSHLRRHKKTAHTKTKTKLLRCTVEGCYQEVSSRTSLLRHIKRIHETQKDHVCEECDAQFTKKHQLRSHMYEHTGVAPFSCEMCTSKFVTITDYKKHKRSHKSYTCKCSEVFYRWTLFRKHMREKCGKQVYTCSTCEKSFTHKPHYTMHLLMHNESREVFECPYEYCERLYYYKRNLRTHIKSFHMKIKPKKTRKRKPVPPKEKRTVRAKRKDAGTIKKSSALRLTGFNVPYEAEKSIIAGDEIEAENISDFVESSDFSDVELRISIISSNKQFERKNQPIELEEDSVSTS